MFTEKHALKIRSDQLTVKQYKQRCSLAVYGYVRHEYNDTPVEIIPLICTFYYFDDRFIKVFCRFRPQNHSERSRNGFEIVTISDNNTVEIDYHKPFKFTFDYIFTQSSQATVYHQIAPQFIDSIFSGYNTSIIVYGQTTAGKTYTIEGENQSEFKGFMPRVIETIFQKINNTSNMFECILKASCIEIYLEKISDLLNNDLKTNRLKIREKKGVHGGRNIYIENITEITVKNVSELINLFALAKNNRQIAATRMSAVSSRSHMIYMLELIQKNRVNGNSLVSKIKFCDLCGSERIKKTGATGQLLKEAKFIGQSLNALGYVVHSIVQKKKHVPYRDSKLTRLLADELGGNCNTFFMINCSPSSWNVDETVSSCRFGRRVQKIINCPRVNHL
eukprot:458020_1